MTGKREEGRQMRDQVKNMKQSIGFTNEKDIDKRIADIEFQLCTTSMALKDEKKLLAEIQELKRNKPKVSQVSQMEGKLQNYDSATPLREQNKALNVDMASLREQKKEIQ